MITLRSLEKDYYFFKKQARINIDKGRYNNAIDAIKTAGTLAQNYCLHYADPEIESMLATIASRIVRRRPIQISDNRIVFYDAFSKDNVMLTTQYVKALINMGKEFMYLTLNNTEKLSSQKFYVDLISNPQVTICTCDSQLSYESATRYLTEKIEQYHPSKVLLHTRAEDIEGILPWYMFPEIEKYYVEVTDHSYWPGVDAIDYCICFRNYGFSNAIKYRGLAEKQTLILPYYPSMGEYNFVGFPENNTKSVKLFSGGRVTKIADKDDTFLNLIKYALEKYPNTEFYYAGGGLMNGAARMQHMMDFIEENNLNNRWHLLGQRKDIYEVTKRMDIFINTYPFGGGLMVQNAAFCSVPVLILSMNGLCKSIEEFIYVDAWDNPRITHFSIDDFKDELDHLINDEEYRENEGKKLKSALITPDVFTRNLEQVLFKHASQVSPHMHEGDYESRRQINIDMENRVFHRHYGILIRSKVLLKKRPLKYFKTVILLLVKSDKAYLKQTIFNRYISKEK